MSLIKIFKLKFILNRSVCNLFIFSSSNLRKVVGPYCSQHCDCSSVVLGQGLTGSTFLLKKVSSGKLFCRFEFQWFWKDNQKAYILTLQVNLECQKSSKSFFFLVIFFQRSGGSFSTSKARRKASKAKLIYKFLPSQKLVHLSGYFCIHSNIT